MGRFSLRSVLKEPDALNFDFVPPSIPFREEYIDRLFHQFKSIFSGTSGRFASFRGSVGTGKTVTARTFLKEMNNVARDEGLEFKSVLVNGRSHPTESAVALQLIRGFNPKFPDRGFSVVEMLNDISQILDRRDTRLLVVIDEADVHLKKAGSNLIYKLTRFREGAPGLKGSVSLILISTKDVLSLMDDASRSTFGSHGTYTFDRYTRDQLKRILGDRESIAFRPGTIDFSVIEEIAENARDRGDARLAIEIMFHAANRADADGAEEVTFDHVRAAVGSLGESVSSGSIDSLPIHKQLALWGVARALGSGRFCTMGEAKTEYEVACEETGEKPRKHTQFWSYVKDLEGMGLVRTEVVMDNTTDTSGKTTRIRLNNLPSSEVQRHIEKNLLGASP